LRRSYDAPVEDVWDAITDPDRIVRWFMPVTGDLRQGGTYQLKGNAGGEIVQCEPPRLLRVTWIYGELPEGTDPSEVQVRLTPGEAGRTVLELDHIAVVEPEFWDQFGPGAVGVGWDLALLGLSLYFTGDEIAEEDREAWSLSPEGREFSTGSSTAWGAALAATGTPDGVVARMVEATTNFYAPPPDQATETV
jgi:uncharacterized protein YndB with AHSA1/START domain